VTAFESVTGRGVIGVVDGHRVAIGNIEHMKALGVDPGALPQRADELRRAGQTVVFVAIDGVAAGIVGVVDPVKPSSVDAVRALRDEGLTIVMLTGDARTTAEAVARTVGIDRVEAGVLPGEKAAAVKRLQAAGARVAMAGDGINDAPALAAAHAGIAMGGAGSDLTLQAADAIVVRDDLSAIPAVIALSRRARRVVVANLVIAAAFITALVSWDLFGHLPLPLGVAGHEGSTVIVGLNGLRLLRNAAWNRAQGN
jgi:P-type E1-E2 ATPase